MVQSFQQRYKALLVDELKLIVLALKYRKVTLRPTHK